MKFKFFVMVFVCLCVSGCGDEVVLLSEQVIESGVLSEGEVSDVPESVWESIQQNYRSFPRGVEVSVFAEEERGFYTKYIDAGGIAILSHAAVADEYLIEARHVVLTMTLRFPALRDRLKVQGGFRMILSETEAIPIFSNGGFRQTCATTYSGRGGGFVKGFCNALVAPPYYGELRSFVHEFAHALQSEMERLAPGFSDRLSEAYQVAIEAGTWKGRYAETNSREYWAEGVEVWFYDIGPGREFASYEAFFDRDRRLAELLDTWFPRVSFR